MDSSMNMKKIIIGDHTYDIPDKVHLLIEDLTNKNTRLKERTKRAYTDGIIWGARQYGGMIVRREDISQELSKGDQNELF